MPLNAGGPGFARRPVLGVVGPAEQDRIRYRRRVLVLSISSLKGGVGKTSVTLGLASAAYNRGIPTLVVDMDPQADSSTGLDVPT